MRKINLLYYRLMCVLVTTLMASLLVPVTLQVLSRYTPLVPTWMWTEEASRFSLIWMIMLGTAIAVRNRRHFNIDLWPDPKTERGKALSRDDRLGQTRSSPSSAAADAGRTIFINPTNRE